MQSSITKLRDQLNLLESFEKKYDAGERGRVGMLSAIWPDEPEVRFDATTDGAWVGRTLGASGWKTETSIGRTRFSKMVDGVHVILDRAFGTVVEDGITLPAEFATDEAEASYPPHSECHPATDPLVLLPALNSARL